MNIPKDIRPNKRLGQYFLIDNLVLIDILDAVGKPGTVFEIGAGTGILTKALANIADKVITIEIDKNLIPVLRSELRSNKNVTLIQGDFLKYELPEVDLVVGNIPYYISSPIIFKLAKESDKYKKAFLMLQKEFTFHLLAKPGSDNWSRLSVTAQHAFKMRLVKDVPARSFWPEVRVDSAIIEFIPTHKTFTDQQNLIISLLFQHKNQTVRNALIHSHKALNISKEQAKKLKVPFSDKRPRDLKTEEILKIAKSL